MNKAKREARSSFAINLKYLAD
uniref:Uncharacterized protein n=1 Tax=Anguilla anguilla TaxID=7936 RepID=A0A0E9UVH9_ANGAN